MIFKFLEKPLVIKAFLTERYSYIPELYPIAPSHKFIPSHWKNTPKGAFNWEKMQQQPTVRSCSGILGTFTNGYILPLWTDLAIKTTENTWQSFCSDSNSTVTDHPNSQFTGFYEDHMFLKMDCPWLFSANMDFGGVFVDPFYTQNKPKPYIIPYGVMHSTNKNMTTNFFLFLKREKNNILIKSGTPMIHMLFLTDKKIRIEPEILSTSEYVKKRAVLSGGLYSSFTNRRAKYLNQLAKWRK
jgi:hypothetical protein